MLIVRININQEEDKIIIKEGNKINIIIVYNVSSEREVKLRDLNVDIYYDSWIKVIVTWLSWKGDPNWVISNTNDSISLF